MSKPNTGLVIEIFSTADDATQRINYWEANGATVTGPTAYIDAVFTDKTIHPEAQLSASTNKNCVWAITVTM